MVYAGQCSRCCVCGDVCVCVYSCTVEQSETRCVRTFHSALSLTLYPSPSFPLLSLSLSLYLSQSLLPSPLSLSHYPSLPPSLFLSFFPSHPPSLFLFLSPSLPPSLSLPISRADPARSVSKRKEEGGGGGRSEEGDSKKNKRSNQRWSQNGWGRKGRGPRDQKSTEPGSTSNHYRILMSWERDYPLGLQATRAPVLYALDNFPEKVRAVKGQPRKTFTSCHLNVCGLTPAT